MGRRDWFSGFVKKGSLAFAKLRGLYCNLISLTLLSIASCVVAWSLITCTIHP